MPSYRLLCRRLCVVGVLAGVAHLLVPARLLATARWGYDRVLATDFDPRPNAPRRVRIVGLAMLCAGLLGYGALRE